jgi:aspartyl/glutamyl-tRNA(Asn/Gln) amidotransferase C subunit
MSNQNSLLSATEVEHIAKLCRLGLTKKEIATTAKNLADVLDHFAIIQKIDTADIPTSDDVTGLKNITHSDQTNPDNLCDRETLLDYAPEVHQDHIKVKAIF